MKFATRTGGDHAQPCVPQLTKHGLKYGIAMGTLDSAGSCFCVLVDSLFRPNAKVESEIRPGVSECSQMAEPSDYVRDEHG